MIKAVHEARRAKYGEGAGKIWLTGVQCTGKEPELSKCEYKPYGEVPSECTHRNDAGVKCLHTGVSRTESLGLVLNPLSATNRFLGNFSI